MALKKLLSDLNVGVPDYPFHHQYNDGGVSSGKSNYIFDHKQLNQKSYKFGLNAPDRIGGGHSK